MSVDNGPMGLFDAIYSVSNSGGSSSASSISGNESPSHGNYPAFEDFSNFTFGDDAEDMSSIDDGPTMTGGKESTGRWTREEHHTFIKGLEMYGKGWKKIAGLIKTRTVVQIRTHAQKYFLKLSKARQNGEHNGSGGLHRHYGDDLRRKRARSTQRPIAVAPFVRPFFIVANAHNMNMNVDNQLMRQQQHNLYAAGAGLASSTTSVSTTSGGGADYDNSSVSPTNSTMTITSNSNSNCSSACPSPTNVLCNTVDDNQNQAESGGRGARSDLNRSESLSTTSAIASTSASTSTRLVGVTIVKSSIADMQHIHQEQEQRLADVESGLYNFLSPYLGTSEVSVDSQNSSTSSISASAGAGDLGTGIGASMLGGNSLSLPLSSAKNQTFSINNLNDKTKVINVLNVLPEWYQKGRDVGMLLEEAEGLDWFADSGVAVISHISKPAKSVPFHNGYTSTSTTSGYTNGYYNGYRFKGLNANAYGYTNGDGYNNSFSGYVNPRPGDIIPQIPVMPVSEESGSESVSVDMDISDISASVIDSVGNGQNAAILTVSRTTTKPTKLNNNKKNINNKNLQCSP